MKHQNGFSLIEVLVTLLIMSIGLLGLAALQAKSLQYNHGAYLRSQANIFAYDIADRMRLNKDEARATDYNIGLSDAIPSASGISGTDKNQWLTQLRDTLPSGDGAVNCASNICTITIVWREAGRNSDDTFTYKTQI